MQTIIYFALILGTLILSLSVLVAAISAQRKRGNVSPKEEKVVKRRIYLPKYTSVPSSPEDEREKMVDYFLKRRNLTLDEKQFIYDFLMETGKEKWRYIEGYWGYYRISSTGFIESCRRHIYLDPTLSKGRYQVVLQVDGATKGQSVHRLVAETFIPNPDDAVSVRPKDGNYLHCDVRNLMWKPKAISSKTAAKLPMKEAA